MEVQTTKMAACSASSVLLLLGCSRGSDAVAACLQTILQKLHFKVESTMNKDQQLPHDISQRLRVLNVLDRITQVNLAREDMEDSLRDMLNLILEVFNADRAFFLHPCDPDAPFWNVPLECTRPKWPGLFAKGVSMPMDSAISKTFSELLSANGTIQYCSNTGHATPPHIAELFSIKSQLMIAIRPKIGDPWVFGLHHCESEVIHDKDDLHLFTAVAQRISDSLSTLISIRQLRESEERWKFALEGAGDEVWDWNPKTDEASFSRRWKGMIGYADNEFPNTGAAVVEHLHPDDKDRVLSAIQEYFTGKQSSYVVEFRMCCKDGSWKWILARGRLVSRDADGNPLRMIGTHSDITERKQMELHLRSVQDDLSEEHALLNSIINSSSDLIFVKDTELRTLLCNEAFAKAVGKHPEDLYGKTDIENGWPAELVKGVPEKGIRGYEQDDLDTLSGVMLRNEHDPVIVNGALRIFDTIKLPLRNAVGEIVGALGIARDITERKRVEESLRESEEKLRAITNSAAAVIYMKDIDGKYLLVNKLYETLFHVDSEKIKGLTDHDIFPKEAADAFRVNDLEVIRLNTPLEMEEHVPHDDGIHVYISKKFSLRDKEGRPYAVCGISTDITERKLAEDEIRVAHTRLQSIIDTAQDAVVQMDAEGIITGWNKQAEKAFGWVREETLGRALHETIIPPQYREAHIQRMKHFLTTGVESIINSRIEIFALHRDGHEFPVELSMAPIKMGDAYEFSIFIHDVTERKHAETELRELNEHLEERVEQRTQQLNNAKKLAEEANRAKSRFLANMSHEIRTPMNSILGMAQLALKNEHDSRQRDYLRKIHLSGEHLLGVIDDILDFSKIDANKLGLENTDFNLDQVEQTLINLVAWRAAEKGLKLTFDFASGIPRNLRGDPLRLNQILINYINNAIKFTEQGEIIVRARRIEEGENDTLLRFEVQDTGIGISEKQKSKLFHAFHQADSSTSRKYGGSGLGLAISQRLAALMGGEVGVESQPGKGSTFWAIVRLDKPGIPELVEPEDVCDRGDQLLDSMEAIQGARILLAEDNLFNQQVTIEFLKDSGATVCIANNGEEALDLLHQEPFDCVLMDVQMPVMDGLEATRLIRDDATLAKIPVIAMTANASNEDRERCLAAGMDDFIGKPFKLDKFYTTIARWVPVRPQQERIPAMLPASILKVSLAGDANVIDFAVLADLMGNDQKKMSEFALMFIDSAKEDIVQIEDALERNDMAAMSALGHRAKSGARMVGATGFANLCQALENGRGSKDVVQA